MAIEFIECITLRADSVVCYNKVIGNVRRQSPFKADNKRNSNGLSKKSARRINESIKFLYASTHSKSVYQKSTSKYYSFKINFITLTLSSKQIHDDKVILKQVFEPFLRICRNKFEGFLYVWKAEVQDNGNIHFHLNTNTFIEQNWLRKTWNKCQDKLNYVNNSSSVNPNSTDVKAVKNSTQLAQYMAKYISKADTYTKLGKRYLKRYKAQLAAQENYCTIPKNFSKCLKRAVKIKLWSCSESLMNPKLSIEGITYDAGIDMYNLTENSRIVVMDYATMYYDVDLRSTKFPYLRTKFFELINQIKQHEKNMVKYFEID